MGLRVKQWKWPLKLGRANGGRWVVAVIHGTGLLMIRVESGLGGNWKWFAVESKIRSLWGDNLFLCSIVALDADTGAYKWHCQTTPETWDYSSNVI